MTVTTIRVKLLKNSFKRVQDLSIPDHFFKM